MENIKDINDMFLETMEKDNIDEVYITNNINLISHSYQMERYEGFKTKKPICKRTENVSLCTNGVKILKIFMKRIGEVKDDKLLNMFVEMVVTLINALYPFGSIIDENCKEHEFERVVSNVITKMIELKRIQESLKLIDELFTKIRKNLRIRKKCVHFITLTHSVISETSHENRQLLLIILTLQLNLIRCYFSVKTNDSIRSIKELLANKGGFTENLTLFYEKCVGSGEQKSSFWLEIYGSYSNFIIRMIHRLLDTNETPSCVGLKTVFVEYCLCVYRCDSTMSSWNGLIEVLFRLEPGVLEKDNISDFKELVWNKVISIDASRETFLLLPVVHIIDHYSVVIENKDEIMVGLAGFYGKLWKCMDSNLLCSGIHACLLKSIIWIYLGILPNTWPNLRPQGYTENCMEWSKSSAGFASKDETVAKYLKWYSLRILTLLRSRGASSLCLFGDHENTEWNISMVVRIANMSYEIIKENTAPEHLVDYLCSITKVLVELYPLETKKGLDALENSCIAIIHTFTHINSEHPSYHNFLHTVFSICKFLSKNVNLTQVFKRLVHVSIHHLLNFRHKKSTEHCFSILLKLVYLRLSHNVIEQDEDFGYYENLYDKLFLLIFRSHKDQSVLESFNSSFFRLLGIKCKVYGVCYTTSEQESVLLVDVPQYSGNIITDWKYTEIFIKESLHHKYQLMRCFAERRLLHINQLISGSYHPVPFESNLDVFEIFVKSNYYYLKLNSHKSVKCFVVGCSEILSRFEKHLDSEAIALISSFLCIWMFISTENLDRDPGQDGLEVNNHILEMETVLLSVFAYYKDTTKVDKKEIHVETITTLIYMLLANGLLSLSLDLFDLVSLSDVDFDHNPSFKYLPLVLASIVGVDLADTHVGKHVFVKDLKIPDYGNKSGCNNIIDTHTYDFLYKHMLLCHYYLSIGDRNSSVDHFAHLDSFLKNINNACEILVTLYHEKDINYLLFLAEYYILRSIYCFKIENELVGSFLVIFGGLYLLDKLTKESTHLEVSSCNVKKNHIYSLHIKILYLRVFDWVGFLYKHVGFYNEAVYYYYQGHKNTTMRKKLFREEENYFEYSFQVKLAHVYLMADKIEEASKLANECTKIKHKFPNHYNLIRETDAMLSVYYSKTGGGLEEHMACLDLLSPKAWRKKVFKCPSASANTWNFVGDNGKSMVSHGHKISILPSEEMILHLVSNLKRIIEEYKTEKKSIVVLYKDDAEGDGDRNTDIDETLVSDEIKCCLEHLVSALKSINCNTSQFLMSKCSRICLDSLVFLIAVLIERKRLPTISKISRGFLVDKIVGFQELGVGMSFKRGRFIKSIDMEYDDALGYPPLFLNKILAGLSSGADHHFLSGENLFRDLSEVLPSTYICVMISIDKKRNFMYITRIQVSEKNKPRRLSMTVACLDLNRNITETEGGKAGSYEYLENEFGTIMKMNKATTTNNSYIQTRVERKQWWESRKLLDRRLRHLLEYVENKWFGVFRYLLSPDLMPNEMVDENNLNLQNQTCNIFRKFVDENIKIDIIMFNVLLLLHRDEKVVDIEPVLKDWIDWVLVYNGLSVCLETRDLLFESLSSIVNVNNSIINPFLSPNDNICNNTHVVLIMNDDINFLPIESLPVLKNTSVSRFPSLSSLCRTLMDIRDTGIKKQMTLRDGILYVINPGGDLTHTQNRLEPIFSRSRPCVRFTDLTDRQDIIKSLDSKWHGVVGLFQGRLPKQSDCLKIYLYFGHGSGDKYMRLHRQRKNLFTSKNAPNLYIAFIMGCSSGMLVPLGLFDNFGPPMDYLLCGCYSVVANLWDVTDKDIDRFSLSVLHKWGLLVDGEEWDGENLDLCQSVVLSRDKCILPYMVGSAPVVYGIPTSFSANVSRFL